MPRLDDLPQLSMLLFKQVQNAYGFGVGRVLRSGGKFSSSKIMLFTGGNGVRSLGFDGCVTCMSMRLALR